MNLTKFGPSSSPSEPVDLRSLGLRMRSAANRRSALSKRQEEVLPPAQKGLEDNDLLVPITDLHAQHGKLDAEGECYYQLRSLLYAMPEQQLKVLLSRGLYRLLDVKSLGIFWGVYMFLSLITYYIALPTDLVIPNLIMGATTGRLLGMAWNYLTTGLDQDPGFFALLGMAGMWSATSRLTLTVIVIAFEMTGDYDAIPALIVTCFSAAFCSSFLGDSLYHREAHRMKVPILPFEAPHVLRSITIRKIMAYRNLVVVTCTATLSACVEAIDTGHIGFPVCEKLDVEDALGRTMTKYRPVGFVMRDLLGETVRNLTREGYDMETTRVDLTSVMNVSPTIVKEDATASKVFSVIRTLGLRHVMVVDADGFLVGLVTRKDLLRGIHAYESGARRRHVGSRRTTHHRRHPDHGTADRHMDHSASTLVVAHQNIRGDRSSLVLPRNENDEKKTAVEETGDHTVHTEASDRVSLCSADNLHLLAATASQVQVDHPPAETMPTSDPIPQPQTIPEADAMQDTRRGSRSSGKRAWMRGVAQIRMRRALQQTLDALRLDEESSSSSSSSSSSDSDSSSSDDEAGRP
ncbi:hypothetical protein DFJ77DRAFT_455130 [Powellomyces hirtus]|nr:hypothetical protein DFJ77DRAFT_455130 [Powellomyces hirtus]